MFYFGHGSEKHADELVQAATPSDYTVLFVVGALVLLAALVLWSRYSRLRAK